MQVPALSTVVIPTQNNNTERLNSSLLCLATTVCRAVCSFFSYPFSILFNAIAKTVACAALPATQYTKEYSLALREELKEQFSHLSTANTSQLLGKENTIQIPNSTSSLSGFTITNNDNPKKRHIIYFGGNIHLADHAFSHCYNLAETLKADVSCYSYPGTGLSTGHVLNDDDLLVYGHTIINHIRENNPEISELILYGYSFGGSIATLLAREYEQQGITLHLINDRSFSNVSSFISQNYPIGLGTIISSLARFCGWKLDASAAAQNLRSKTFVITARNDECMRSEGNVRFITSYSPLPSHVTAHIHQGSHLSPLEKETDFKAIANFLN